MTVYTYKQCIYVQPYSEKIKKLTHMDISFRWKGLKIKTVVLLAS
jgi:hypothetical protein